MTGGIREDWFPTAIWYFDVEAAPARNERLVAAIRTERERGGGAVRSSVLGWQSPEDLHLRLDLAGLPEVVLASVFEVARFNRWDLERVVPCLTECWANVNPRFGSNAVHAHPRAVLSAIYHVQAPEGCGGTFFVDPREGPAAVAPPLAEWTAWTYDRIVYRAVPGRLLIFPGWLRHGVEPNVGDGERISLNFNVGVVPKAG